MDFVLSNKNVRHLLLPAMFPLILYNGDDSWTVPDTLEALIENTVKLGEYGMPFKHLVIAENEFGKETLLRIRNIISTLFLAESHYDYELLRDELLNLCDTEQDVQALELFINWLRQLAHHGKIDGVGVGIGHGQIIHDLGRGGECDGLHAAHTAVGTAEGSANR